MMVCAGRGGEDWSCVGGRVGAAISECRMILLLLSDTMWLCSRMSPVDDCLQYSYWQCRLIIWSRNHIIIGLMQNPLSSRPHPSSPKFPTTASTPSNPQAPTSSFDKPTKKKISKGSQLFSEIQSLTNKIKMIDKSQDKLIQERIQRTYSREGSVTSKKLDDSTNVHSLTDLPPKASTKHPDVLVPCEGCKRKEE